MRRLLMLSVGVLGALAPMGASAATIAYEGFDYPNDSAAIQGKNGGAGWLGPWIDSSGDFQRLSQDDVSLDSPAFPFTPVGDRTVATGNGGVSAARDMPEFPLAQDGVLYASFLWRKEKDSGATADNVEFQFSSASNPTVVRIGSTSSEGFLVRLGTANADFGSAPTAETLFTVVKITASALAADTLQVTFYDSSESAPVLEPVAWDATASVAGSNPLTRVRIAYGANVHAAVDEIRLGTTWASVTAVPEPASVSSVVIGFCAAVAGRRRRA